MLFLVMQLDGNRYALDIRQVAEVLPLVNIETIARASAVVAGIINYGGAPVPVIDLSRLLMDRPAHRRLSTRIVLVRHAAGGPHDLVGLIAERATETMRRDSGDFREAGQSQLGLVAFDAAGPVHWLDVERLLAEAPSESLLRRAVAS
jgi:chemotaxis-related protein WspB